MESAPNRRKSISPVSLSEQDVQAVGKQLKQARQAKRSIATERTGPRKSKQRPSENPSLAERTQVLQWSLEATLKLPSNSAYAKHRIATLRQALLLLAQQR